MRTHRINMNLLVDHNHRAFLSNVARFVDQINNVAHINLFLTDLMYAKLNFYTSYSHVFVTMLFRGTVLFSARKTSPARCTQPRTAMRLERV